MKLNNSKKIKKYHINQNPHNIDTFWDDCIKGEPLQNNIRPNKHSLNINDINNNNYNMSKRINYKKINYKNKVYDSHKSYIVNNCYKKLREKIPNLYKEDQDNISKKLKIKNSLKRSLLLYSYGLEVLKANKANISQNKKLKEQEELKLCTWKPKLNKNKNISIKHKKYKYKDIYTKNNLNKNKIEEEMDILNIDSECTFHPQIKKSKLKNVFNRSKSMLLYTDRENSSFILRYKKARDEYMIKRFKQLNEKDDSYNSSFIELTSRAIDQTYKNYLNVNTNIQIYDKLSSKNNYKNNSRMFNFSASNDSNISNFNSSNNISIQNIKVNKSKKYYVGLLKKQLRLIDLEI